MASSFDSLPDVKVPLRPQTFFQPSVPNTIQPSAPPLEDEAIEEIKNEVESKTCISQKVMRAVHSGFGLYNRVRDLM